jgi:hypothetical protein
VNPSRAVAFEASGEWSGYDAGFDLVRDSAAAAASQTLVAPALAIQRQLAAGELAGESGAGPPTAPAAGESDAGGAAGASSLVLDKLAREVYDRLRRRLIVERERAGLSAVFS